MTMQRWSPGLAAALLAVLCLSADRVQAGSFLGPCCYGAPFTQEYPNRSHNVFGAAAGIQCPARHPFFKHRWFRKHQGAPCDGATVNVMPGYGAPVEVMPAPVAPAPIVTAPIQATAVTPAPAVSAPIAPVAVPLPAGPSNAEPSAGNSPSKPPF